MTEKKADKSRKHEKYTIIVMVLIILIFSLNVAACYTPFCDWYKLHIYNLISDGLGRVTAVVPVAIGELMMYAGILLLLFAVPVLVLLPFLRKKAGFRHFAAFYYKGLFMTGLVILLLYTTNWVIPFCGSVMEVKGAVKRSYTVQEIVSVRNEIVNQLNACAEQAPRDENGHLIYDKKALQESVIASMQKLAVDYPLLSGYYPPMKDALCSDFLEWMRIGGYTYPFTMEITGNKYEPNLYYAALFAHESAHHQGYYQENEGNFFEFLGCISSDDVLVRYAGYMSIYWFIEDAYSDAVNLSMSGDELIAFLRKQPKLSDRVWDDEQEAIDEAEEKYEEESHPAQELAPTASKVADVGWDVQADILQENNYDGVIGMVLEYYDTLPDSPYRR